MLELALLPRGGLRFVLLPRRHMRPEPLNSRVIDRAEVNPF